MTTDATITPTSSEVEKPEPGSWSITWEGQTWHETSVDGRHLAYICLLNGEDTWGHLNLRELSPVHGPGRLMSWIITFIAVRDEITDDAVLAELIKKVRETSAGDLLDTLTFH